MKKNKFLKFILAAFIVALSAAALEAAWHFISKGSSPETHIAVSDAGAMPSAVQKEEPMQDIHAGQARSRLTGLWVDEAGADNVPYAVMYSNIYDAMPQSSIGEADVVFESLVEGGITRLCCLFENKDALEKIGPVRSCRTYYLLFAKEFEAVYVHYGYSEYAERYLVQPGFHSLEGMVYCDFYRSSDRVAPHNAYTSWAGITKSAQEKGYPLTYGETYASPFLFNTDDDKAVVLEQGSPCQKAYMGYPNNQPWFEYDEASGSYLRYQFGGPQIDAETGMQLSFQNILVKYVTPAYYENGTPDYRIYGSGRGLYITNGMAAEVIWAKESETEGPTKYYYSDGTEIVLNQGKTWICQVETSQEVKILDN